jgi:serine/threonine protein kinase
MMLQIGQGMLYLHENRVVHRDLKAQNILVKSRKDGDTTYLYAKVADFGLSKTKEKSSSYSNLTSNIGTTRWMAPKLMLMQDISKQPMFQS